MVKNKFTSAEKSRIVLVPEHKHQYGRIVQKIQYSSTDILPVERAICKRLQGLTYGTPNGNVCKNLQKENDSLKKLIGEITIANDILKKTLENQKR